MEERKHERTPRRPRLKPGKQKPQAPGRRRRRRRRRRGHPSLRVIPPHRRDAHGTGPVPPPTPTPTRRMLRKEDHRPRQMAVSRPRPPVSSSYPDSPVRGASNRGTIGEPPPSSALPHQSIGPGSKPWRFTEFLLEERERAK